MKYVNKQAFTLFESLIAFSVFSFILMLYVPAYFQEVERIKNEYAETSKLRILYEHVKMDMETQGIVYPAKHAQFTVDAFECQPLYCQIFFNDGSSYQIELLMQNDG